MSNPADDLSATVAYSTDKWLMDRVPWAMWVCVAGLVVVLHAEHRGVNGAALALVYLALLGLAFASWVATTMIDRSPYPFYVTLPVGILVAILLAGVIVALGVVFGGSSGPRYAGGGQGWWGRLVNPPTHVFGWMMIYLGLGWIGFAVVRHFHPGRPIVMLSPRGVAFHRSWLPNILIPWQDVKGVGALEIETDGGPPTLAPHVIAVVVTKDFYERHIAPKRGFLAPPGSEFMFRPKGAMMQVVLTQAEVTVDPKHLHVPIEARWTAFRDRAASVPDVGSASGPPIDFARWSIDGSPWQAIMFLAPIAGMIAVALHAGGIWR